MRFDILEAQKFNKKRGQRIISCLQKDTKMDYIVIILIFGISHLLAYLIIRKKISLKNKLIINSAFLLVSGVLMLLTGIREITVLAFMLLILFTVLGILTRLLAPVILNIVGNIVSKISNDTYQKLSYDQMLQESHKMYFCILLYTTVKVFLYIVLLLSCVVPI